MRRPDVSSVGFDAPVHSISLSENGSLFVGTGAGTVLVFKSGK
jgi:hypothetical protein